MEDSIKQFFFQITTNLFQSHNGFFGKGESSSYNSNNGGNKKHVNRKTEERRFRVIRAKEKAIRELICETIIEKSKSFFGLPDAADVVFDFKLDLTCGDLICVAHNDIACRDNAFDFEPIEQEIVETTESLFGDSNYIILKNG